MRKYFSATARHAKAQEFLELKQGTMTVTEYVARFTELARFGDDHVATDMDSMVGTTLAIEREMEDAQGIRDASAVGKRKEDQPSLSLGKRQRTYVP